MKIKAGQDNPVSPCMLLIEEGAGKNARTHQFVIIFQSTPVTEFYHDFHTIDKIKDRIAYLESFKPKPVAPPTPQPSRDEPKVNADSLMSAMAAEQDKTDPNKIVLDGITIDRKEFQEKVQDRLNRLQKYIEDLSGNQHKNDYRQIVDNTMHLFNDDTTRKVMINNSTGIVTKSVRSYLLKLAQLNYSNVKVSIHDIQFVSKLEAQPDGTYKGYAVYLQEFKGKRGEKEYHSTDRKTVEIIIKIWDELKDGIEKRKYDAFLGNINVEDNQNRR